MPPRRKFNPKRRIAEGVPDHERERLLAGVQYVGSAYHKSNPGDFGLTPPSQPRPDKTLCDVVMIFEHEVALRCLRRGIERGLVSAVPVGGWPKYIWSITDDGHPLEAQCDNTGCCHGYPLPDADPFADVVRRRWGAIDGDE